jgi:glyoxylase-like metal-dependent hydrolase (beta-lactamase superfamily II)
VSPDGTGRQAALFEDVVRVRAGNPGMMTGSGTNTYLVGRDRLMVIDPGPDDPRHLDAVATAGAGRIRSILVTHTHPDHAPGAARLAAWTGAERVGFASRDGFTADRMVGDGWTPDPPGPRIRAVATPGHASNHLCYLLDREGGEAGPTRVLFTGDHVMDGSTVVISPPDGDMGAYLASLRRVLALDPPVDVIAPGHGELIVDPSRVVAGIVEHRLRRGEKVADALRSAGRATVDQLVPAVYDDVEWERYPVARRSLWAHLQLLAAEGRVEVDDPDDEGAVWRWTPA